MIPLTMVTGFLGAGKTTFLKHIAHKYSDSRIVYLINEFSPQDMDGIQLEQDTDNVMSIPGGSIFCRCLAGQFIEYLTEIHKQYHHPGNPVKGVVIEASGVAGPQVAGRMLAESRLDKIYEIRRIVCVIDPGSVHKLLQTLPNIKSQITAADTILINKTDCFDETEINRTEQIVRELAPSPSVIRTAYCEADIDVFEQAVESSAEGGDYALCRDPNYEHLLVECAEPVDPEWLKKQLKAFASDMYRAKGLFLGTDNEKKWLEYTPNGISISPADTLVSEDELLRIVFILRTEADEMIKTFAEELGRVIVHV